ncbi:hypothetical protein ACEPPN_005705 [Leptodophora sp. 'Broadleaf-Isolate-01']
MEITSEAAKEIDFRDLAGVGQGIRRAMADDIRINVAQMPTTPFYEQAAAEYPFEALDTKAIAEVVRPAVDAWFNDDKNTERTAQRFRIGNKDSLVLLSWCVIRTKAAKMPKQITGGLFNNEHEIAVFIALGDWKESNGIFAIQQWSQQEESRRGSEEQPLAYIELKSGEDVSVNGADTLFFSGRPGGLALMLRLQFPFGESQ